MKALGTALMLFAAVTNGLRAEVPKPEVGGTDAHGHFIIAVFTTTKKAARPVVLQTPYGLIVSRGSDGYPMFTLAAQEAKTVREFSSYEKLLAAFGELPKGSTIHIYSRCLLPVFYDFAPVHVEMRAKLLDDCTRLGLKLSDDVIITCTCED